jgi:hypothetical protein
MRDLGPAQKCLSGDLAAAIRVPPEALRLPPLLLRSRAELRWTTALGVHGCSAMSARERKSAPLARGRQARRRCRALRGGRLLGSRDSAARRHLAGYGGTLAPSLEMSAPPRPEDAPAPPAGARHPVRGTNGLPQVEERRRPYGKQGRPSYRLKVVRAGAAVVVAVAAVRAGGVRPLGAG